MEATLESLLQIASRFMSVNMDKGPSITPSHHERDERASIAETPNIIET